MSILSKIVIVISAIILIISSSLYFLLNTVYLANTDISIATQRAYSTIKAIFTTKRNKPNNTIITTQKFQKENETLYIYKLEGFFEEINTEKGQIYIRGNNNEMYIFDLVYEKSGELQYYDIMKDRLVSNTDVSPFIPGDIIAINWADNRNLENIIKDYYLSPNKTINYQGKHKGLQALYRIYYENK